MLSRKANLAEQFRHAYVVERELADRLRRAAKDERRVLYTAVYNELFRRVPEHPQNIRKADLAAQATETVRQLGRIARFLRPSTTYLEIGPGDCALAIAVARRVAHVYAVDVSDEIAKRTDMPTNLQLIISDGVTVPVPAGSVDVAYSNQLMEHLHPDDAQEQLGYIARALRPGGIYVCITPNRLCGPHDVSMFFDATPTGFHLKEYTNGELVSLSQAGGYRSFQALVSYKGFIFPWLLPMRPFIYLEHCLNNLPGALRHTLAKSLLAVKLVATK